MAGSDIVSSPTPAFQAILEKFAAEAEIVCADLRAQARAEVAAQLNQAVRRIRQSETREELGEITEDAARAFASGALWLTIEGESARSEKRDLEIPFSEAAALKEAAQSREPVVAIATAAEVSAPLAQTADGRALVYPILARDTVGALLYASANFANGAQNAALELLAQVASSVWQNLEPPAAPAPPLVSIAPAAKPANIWETLGAEEQQIHLRAQRYARVQVAEMRLRHAAAVQSGRMRRNLYESLRDPINAAREAYRKEFFANSPSMVDYLHLELTRTLANEESDLLGKDYPGPMV
jgi:hypothetical protein